MASEKTLIDLVQDVSDWSAIDPDGTMAGVPASFSLKRAAAWLGRQGADQAFVVDNKGERLGSVTLVDLQSEILGDLPGMAGGPALPAGPSWAVPQALMIGLDVYEEDWVFECDRTWNHGGEKKTYPFNPGQPTCKPKTWTCWGHLCGDCSMKKKKRKD